MSPVTFDPQVQRGSRHICPRRHPTASGMSERRPRLKGPSANLSELPPASLQHPIINDRSERSLTHDRSQSALMTSRRYLMDYTPLDLLPV